MVLRILTWLFSLAAHGALAVALVLPSGGSALEQGHGDDIMVVEQGIVLQGFAKLGEDVVTVEAVQAPPAQMAAAQPLPETMRPVEEVPLEEPEVVKTVQEHQVIASDAGPEQDNVKEIDPKEMEEVDLDAIEEELTPSEVNKPKEVWTHQPVDMLKDLEPGEKDQPAPPQAASVPLESVIAMRQSSGEEIEGGDATAHRAYLGKLRTHLEHSKVNPRTKLMGTTIVRVTVGADGTLISQRIVQSSGSKILDDAAMASITKASPFPPIPNELNRSTLEVSVSFKFTVR